MNRKRKLLLNTLAGIIKQLITVVCGFILPRYMMLYYGSTVNGLVSSITNFLGVISLLDMGVGAVVQANLYEPLAKKDIKRISRIVKSSSRFFRRLSYIFIGYVFILMIIFTTVINDAFEPFFSISLLVIIAISTFVQYLFGMTYQLLLNADQRSYIQLTMQIVTILLNTILAIFMMKAGASVHMVKLMTSIVYVLRPLGQAIYVQKHYKIDSKITVVGEPIKQKWNGFAQHLAAVVCQNIDIVVLSVFSTLEKVSVYSAYYNVTHGVQQIIMTAATGLESMFGNMIANGEKEKLLHAFSTAEWIVHMGVTFVFTIAAIMIVPFVTIYTKGIEDADYIVPLFGVLLVIAYAVQCLRVPYFRMIKAAGHFKQTQNGAYISALLNILITVGMVFKFGLVGAALGTFVAMLYHTCYFAWYLRRNILERSMVYFCKYILIDFFIGAISIFICSHMTIEPTGYFFWVIDALKVCMIVSIVMLLMNIIFYRKETKSMMRLLRHRI